MIEHLAWLDQEITIESGSQIKEADPIAIESGSEAGIQKPILKVAASSTQQTVKPTPLAEELPVAAKTAEPEDENIEQLSDQLISQFSNSDIRHEMDPKLGLALYFGGALGILAIVVFLFYWFGYR